MLHFLIWVHVISACLWIGGSLFLVLVLLPVLKTEAWAPHYRTLLRDIVVRFRSIAWVTLSLLVVTGVLLVGHRIVGSFEVLIDSGWGRTVSLKAGVVTLILSLSAYHDWRTGPAAMQALRDNPGAPASLRMRKVAMLIGRLNLLLGLLVVWLAVGLPRGL